MNPNDAMSLYRHIKGNCLISTTVHIRFWFGWRKQLSSLLTSFKSKCRVLCGGSYTSVVLVLYGSIFDGVFNFSFLAFEPYHMVDPSTVQCPLLVFSVRLPIKGCQSRDCSKPIPISLKPSPKVSRWNTLHSQLILESTIICSRVVLVEMFIIVLENTNINIYIWLNMSP